MNTKQASPLLFGALFIFVSIVYTLKYNSNLLNQNDEHSEVFYVSGEYEFVVLFEFIINGFILGIISTIIYLKKQINSKN